MKGWVKLHRQLIENGWLKNPKLFVFWIYCLLKAAHEPFKATVGYQEVNLEPGQFIFGRKIAAEETGLREQEIRSCLNSLRKRQNLTIKSTNKFSIISITNWQRYQGLRDGDKPPNQPASNQQPTTYKNEKNQKKYLEGSVEIGLSSFLLQEIRKNKPDFREPNLQEWAEAVDSMIRLDGRKPEKIRQVIGWAQRDPFWHKNMLSTMKLREHFDRLEMTMGDVNPW